MKDLTMSERTCQLHLSQDIGMYYCGKRVKTKNHVYGPEIRDHYLFLLVDSGSAVLKGKKDVVFKEHDMLVMCPDQKIHYKALTDWSIRWIGLYGKTVDDLMKKLGVTGETPILHIHLYPEIAAVFKEIYELSGTLSFANNLKITSLVYSFFHWLFLNQNASHEIDAVDAAIRIMNYNYNTDLSIEALSGSLGFDPAYFSRLFKSRVGVSPKKYLLNKRMERALALLKNTKATVQEVSFSVGYEDALYFSKVFKKTFGISPKSYRFENEMRRGNGAADVPECD